MDFTVELQGVGFSARRRAERGLRREYPTPVLRAIVRLGDASYAMYLFHPFVMRGFTLLGARLDAHTEASGIIIAAASMVVAQICALAINAGFERKLTKMLRSRT